MAFRKRTGTTPETVARAATIPGALEHGETVVIGLFGRESGLEALIRLPGGRIKRVKPGSRLPAGRIAGIDRKGIVVEKGGTTRRLAVPGG